MFNLVFSDFFYNAHKLHQFMAVIFPPFFYYLWVDFFRARELKIAQYHMALQEMERIDEEEPLAEDADEKTLFLRQQVCYFNSFLKVGFSF